VACRQESRNGWGDHGWFPRQRATFPLQRNNRDGSIAIQRLAI
jgi:hypothetical protein